MDDATKIKQNSFGQTSVIKTGVPSSIKEAENDFRKRVFSAPLVSQDDFERSDSANVSLSTKAADQAEHFGKKILEETNSAEQLVNKLWNDVWKVCLFSSLPEWLQDNDYLLRGHRPPLKSFRACFKSVFKIHTETINIWTHLLGCVFFIGVAAYSLYNTVYWIERIVLGIFYASVILCLGMSSVYHIVNCHSEYVRKLFRKFDYCGISLLIIGSFVPWIYYGFYCEYLPKIFYLVLVCVLGTVFITLSLWGKFTDPRFRGLRAFLFACFGLSAVVPAVHYTIVKGFFQAVGFGWLCLMAYLYLLGAALYALRIPERFFPGKCDIWFHSHQIFHVLVIAAATVHYHGITVMAAYTQTIGSCNS